MEKMLLSIDIGTTRVKAVLFDDTAASVLSQWCDVNTLQQQNCSEIDMEILWQHVVTVVRKVVSQMDEHQEIIGIGVSGQGEGLWLLDGSQRPVIPAILWNDARAISLVEILRSDTALTEQVKYITGSELFPGATSVLLKWLKLNKVDDYDRVAHILFCKDWIRYRLTGELYTDRTDASTSLLDIRAGELSESLFEILNIPESITKVPPVLNPYDCAGKVTAEAAKQTGLPEGVRVAAGALDIVATALGSGAVCTNDACTILGTTGCNMMVSDLEGLEVVNQGGTELHVLPGTFLRVSASMAATPNLDWILRMSGNTVSFDELEEQLKTLPAGSAGVMYHPYISTAGERAPFYSPGARAQFTGISEHIDFAMLINAVYEGVTYSIRDCLSSHQSINALHLGGGGARSSFWAQMIADCLGISVLVSSEGELGSRGTALLAGVASGLYDDIVTASQMVASVQVYRPRSDRKHIYDQLFPIYTQIRSAMMPIWQVKDEIHNNQEKGGI